MTNLHYVIVSPDMIWLWYIDEHGGKHVTELLNKQASAFLANLDAEAAEKINDGQKIHVRNSDLQ